MEEYNRQASEFIFRENNANGRVPADTIDLHGQFVEEAEEILEERIKYAKAHGQSHLHVCVPPVSIIIYIYIYWTFNCHAPLLTFSQVSSAKVIIR